MTHAKPEAIVVGAGPAGLAAAHALREGGVKSILVVDRDDAPGGLPRFCAHPGFGWEFTSRLESGPAFSKRLLGALDPDTVNVATRTTALSIRPGPVVELVGPETGHVRMAAGVVVIATGARERPRSARLVGGRRPSTGVLNTGQLQQLVARGMAPPGRRAVVVGSEHVAFSVLLTARKAGISVCEILEPGPNVRSFPFAGWIACGLGTPVRRNARVEEIIGSERVEGVLLREPGGLRTVSCDIVVFSGDFVPDAVLARESGLQIDVATGGPIVDQYGRTNLPGVFAAGNGLRAIESSGWAAIEGASVGRAAAASLRDRSHWRPVVARIEAGLGVAYVVPQLWSSPQPGPVGALPASVRASRDARGVRISLSRDDEPAWAGRTRNIRTDRRIKIPDATLGDVASAGGLVRVAIS
jgi:NADPH-dependent 2,4-dienoyl-CoA reductase/sulfur reductase-like enzyme